MSNLRRISLSLAVTAGILLVAAPVSHANIQPPPELILRMWPFFRSHRPVPLLPPEHGETVEPTEPMPEKRPLVAPFVPRKLDINSASFSQIQNLPGIDSSTAARIFAGRPYRDVQDLERTGVPLNVVQDLADQVMFGP